MQNTVRGLHLAQAVPPFRGDGGQFRHARGIGPCRPPHQNFAPGHQDIATFDEPGTFDPAQVVIATGQRWLHFRDLAQPGWGARPHQHCPFRQAQRRVLDELRVGKGGERGQLDHLGPGRFQRRHIVGVIGQHPVQIGRTGVFRAQPVDDGRGRAAGDGTGKGAARVGHGVSFRLVTLISSSAGPGCARAARNVSATAPGSAVQR